MIALHDNDGNNVLDLTYEIENILFLYINVKIFLVFWGSELKWEITPSTSIY